MSNKMSRHNKRIRTGDRVMVIAGNDRGLVGEVVSRTLEKVVVRGVNVRKKHIKRSQLNPQGGIVEMEKPIHLSNVAICLDEEKPRRLRVGYDKKQQRVLVYREGDADVPFRPVRKPKS